ncbi:MAG: hypothetical protein ACLPID_07805 [Beijerinckiaceae bacterium]
MPAILTRKDKPGDPTLDARREARGDMQTAAATPAAFSIPGLTVERRA